MYRYIKGMFGVFIYAINHRKARQQSADHVHRYGSAGLVEARETAVHLVKFALVVKRFLVRCFGRRYVVVNVVGVEDGEVLPVATSFGCFHVVDQRAICFRMT